MSDPIFQRSLQDLIKGIRSHKRDPSSFISQAMAEIKAELKSTDPFLKAEAVRKLTYLQMIGYNVSWASFSIVEVMSQPRFAHKRIGYLAANQTFDDHTDVILLTTNLFKKEFGTNSPSSQYDIGLAVNCLANISTKELARDCIGDLVLLINHSRPYVRKKAILAMYKLYVKFPQGLRLTFDKLKEKLDDPESAVVSTAVNVICELANKNPKNYLAMAPKFFRLLTTSANNWMLIKVVKLLGSLVSEEPRLARKLLEPLATIIENTGAKSLEYECIYTLTEALPYSRREDGSEAKNAPAVIKLCSDHLRKFIEESDQNLKYLGLVGLCNLMRSSPRSVVEHRDIILSCLNDDDITIRSKALELLAGIVSKKSLVDLVQHLLQHAKRSEGSYRDEVISKILGMCKKEKYSLVTDFAWYISVLLELAVMQGTKHGNEVADQLIEITLRVDAVRPYAVEMMLGMLFNEAVLMGHARSTVVEVLKAAAWIVGEYADIVTIIAHDNEDDDSENAYWIEAITGEEIRSMWRNKRLHLMVIQTLLHARTTTFSTPVQVVFIQAALKIFVRSCNDCDFQELVDIISVVRNGLPMFLQNIDLEVQERASTFRHVLAEFDILPMNWEESSELVKEERVESDKNQLNLLDLMPVYTPSSVKAIDENGTRNAVQRRSTLAALTNEKFYAVHSKAQRRVPVPDGLNIDQPFNSSALDKLLHVEIPEELTVGSLTLLKDVPSKLTSKVATLDEEETRLSKLVQSSFLDEDIDTTSNRDSFPPALTNASSSNTRSTADDVFILSSKKNGNGVDSNLSKLLGETFDETSSAAHKSRRKSKKSSKSSSSKKKAPEIDKRELLPAGARSSEDEDDLGRQQSRKSKPNKDDEMDLYSVDITTPLREDEVLTQPTHRVVNTNISSTCALEEKSSKKSKKSSKDKDSTKESKKSSRKSKKSVAVTGDDLLSLDWDNSANQNHSAPIADLLDMEGGAVSGSHNFSASTTVAGISSKKSGSFAQRLISNGTCDVMYHVTAKGNEVTVRWKCSNLCEDSISVIVTIQSSPFIAKFHHGQTIDIATNLAAGSSDVVESKYSLHHPLTDHIVLASNITIHRASLIGHDSSSSSGSIHFHTVSSFVAYKLTEDEFQEKISKSSNKWSSSSVQVPSSSKSKTAFKGIASFLHAHMVESESSKAVSMSAKTLSGCKIFVLAKSVSSGSAVQVDIKCLGSDNAESQLVANIIAASLRDIVL